MGTLTVSKIVSFVTSVSPEYTTDITSGNVNCIVLIAVHRTRSPPPPALLPLTKSLKKYTNRDERTRQRPYDLFGRIIIFFALTVFLLDLNAFEIVH